MRSNHVVQAWPAVVPNATTPLNAMPIEAPSSGRLRSASISTISGNIAQPPPAEASNCGTSNSGTEASADTPVSAHVPKAMQARLEASTVRGSNTRTSGKLARNPPRLSTAPQPSQAGIFA